MSAQEYRQLRQVTRSSQN